MRSSKQGIVVSRTYSPASDHCARALALLLKEPVSKEGGLTTGSPEPDAAVRVKYGEEVSHVEQRTR